MKCADPILCYISNGIKIYRNFSVASPIHRQCAQLVFDCRQCPSCRKKRATELAMCCVLESSLYKHNCFLTLTYDESHEEYHNNFNYRDIQLFKKNFRRYADYHFNKKVRIFNVHEYGRNGKKHWHLVVFNHDFSLDFVDKKLVPWELYTKKNGHNLYTQTKLTELWPFGHHTIGSVTEASAMYQAQYTQKDLKYGNIHEKKFHSKHSGIGREWFLQNYDQVLRLGYVPFNGRKAPIPRYFQKLSHKHYSHFYEPKNFIDYEDRKKLYTPFKPGQANRHMAELYVQYYNKRQIEIEQRTLEWEEEIKPFIYSKEEPDFAKSGKNYVYDLKNKINSNHF